MSETTKLQTFLKKCSRRSVFKGGVLGAIGLGVLKGSKASAQAGSSATKGRLAIIGGGMGGISTAYFCDSEWTIDLFEAQAKIGGHADTVAVEEEGEHIAIDLGAAFFHPETHPLYWSLLSEIGLIDSRNDVRLASLGSMSIFDAKSLNSLFTSAFPMENLASSRDFLTFTQAARKAVEDAVPWDLTLGPWVDSLSLSDDFKHKIILPWLASFTCLDAVEVRKQGTRSHLGALAKTFPKSIFTKAITYNSNIGLGGILEVLAGRCRNLTIHTDSAALKVEEIDGVWFIETAKGREGPFDAVVVNAPPHASVKFLSSIPWASDLVTLLSRREYYPTHIVAHRDPVYMPGDAKNWSLQNVAIGTNHAESSVYLGLIHTPLASGKRVQIFKSWVGKRANLPQDVIIERDFTHPFVTPEVLKQTKELRKWQGRKGLYFAGNFATVADSQDTALFSGMRVAQQIAPYSSNLNSYLKRLVSENKSSITYDVQ